MNRLKSSKKFVAELVGSSSENISSIPSCHLVVPTVKLEEPPATSTPSPSPSLPSTPPSTGKVFSLTPLFVHNPNVSQLNSDWYVRGSKRSLYSAQSKSPLENCDLEESKVGLGRILPFLNFNLKVFFCSP